MPRSDPVGPLERTPLGTVLSRAQAAWVVAAFHRAGGPSSPG
jgi:hypothetical protein